MDRRIELIISKFETETARSWDTAMLAALVDLSPSSFRHLFKQETGTSPAQYLKAFRLRNAEVMLRSTPDRSRAVAEINAATPGPGSTKYGPALKLAGSLS